MSQLSHRFRSKYKQHGFQATPKGKLVTASNLTQKDVDAMLQIPNAAKMLEANPEFKETQAQATSNQDGQDGQESQESQTKADQDAAKGQAQTQAKGSQDAGNGQDGQGAQKAQTQDKESQGTGDGQGTQETKSQAKSGQDGQGQTQKKKKPGRPKKKPE